MAKPLCLLLPILLLALTGCGGGDGGGDAGAAEYVAVAEELNTLLDSVKDGASAKTAAPKVRALVPRAKSVRDKVAPAGGPTGTPQLGGLEGRADVAMQGILDKRTRMNLVPDIRKEIEKDIDEFLSAWSGTPIGPTV